MGVGAARLSWATAPVFILQLPLKEPPPTLHQGRFPRVVRGELIVSVGFLCTRFSEVALAGPVWGVIFLCCE